MAQSLTNQNAPSSYRSFAEIGDDNHILIHEPPSERENSMPWRTYMQDLDDFFIRLYKYHQKSGFVCLSCLQLVELAQIVYSVFLPIFFLNYIDYDILFRNKDPDPKNPNRKVTLNDIIIPFDKVTIPPIQRVAISLAVIFLIWKIVKTIHSIIVNLAIRKFYKDVLHINDCSSLTWQDVQTRIINSKHIFLAQDSLLTELDVHNRILRHNNYMIALINREVLPIYYNAPFVGKTVLFTQSFFYNCQLLFFRGPFKCIFEQNWLISDDVKNASHRQLVAKKLKRHIMILALINLSLSPVLLVWQVLYFFYSNAALVKRDPNVLGLRNWSLYARWFCRHFNEMDHQLNDRLNHAYKPAKNYMEMFTSPLLEIFARHVRFVAGSTFAVLLLLTIYDEDVIQVVHLLTIITALWLIWSSAGGFIPPDIPQRFTKTELYEQVLQHIHYVPHNYPPFTPQARASMSDLFQYKIVRLIEDLISTIATPYIMIRFLRSRSLEIVDFFRNYTVEIIGTGDVCVFSLMNIKENGNPVWQPKITPLKHEFSDHNMDGDNLDEYMEDDQVRNPQRTYHREDSSSNIHRGGAQTQNPAHYDEDSDDSSSQRKTIHQFERETIHNRAAPLQTEYGKLELSLINFKLQNPSWNPASETQKEFIQQVTSQAIEQASSRHHGHLSHSYDDQDNDRQAPTCSELLERTRSPNQINDIDSSTAIGLSTMFLHEHARMPMSTHLPSTSSSSQHHKDKTESDPLL